MPTIVKTPLRISFFGGGTDYREYFERHGGAVLGGTIDKFIYQVCLPMSPVAETRYRLTYSRIETIDRPEEIQHPVIREVLRDEGYVTIGVVAAQDVEAAETPSEAASAAPPAPPAETIADEAGESPSEHSDDTEPESRPAASDRTVMTR